MAEPLSVKLRCNSWKQLKAIHARDLSRGAFFLKTSKPPPLDVNVRISLTMPSGSTVEFNGVIKMYYGPGEFGGRGPGVDIALLNIPQSVMWLIESALQAVERTPPKGPAVMTPPPPSLEDGTEWLKAENELVDALLVELRGMPQLNAFQRLGVSYHADDEDVRAAFGALSKKYHPDKFTRYESVRIRELANEVFVLLRDAYQSIAKPDDRKRLLRRLQFNGGGQSQPVAKPGGRNPTGPPPIPLPPPVPSPTRTMAFAPVRPDAVRPRGPLPAQTAAPPPPPSSEQTQPMFPVDRVEFALNLLDRGEYEQTIRILTVEVRKDSGNVAAQAGVALAEGRMALVNGNRMEAAECFERALEIEPSSERAATALSEMRQHATSQRRSLLSRLMSKNNE